MEVFLMSSSAKFQSVADAPTHNILRTSTQTVPMLLEQIKPLLNNDFFTRTFNQDYWNNQQIIGTDLDSICAYLSDGGCSFNDLTGDTSSNQGTSSQALIALNNTLSPLLTLNFSDLANSNSPVKVKVETYIDFASTQAIQGRPGYFTDMLADVTFAMPVHVPVSTPGKSHPSSLYMFIKFKVSAELNLVNGSVILKPEHKGSPIWNFENFTDHFSITVKSELNFEDTHCNILHSITVPLLHSLRFIDDLEQRIHNMIAMRIFKNQNDFSKLLSQYRSN